MVSLAPILWLTILLQAAVTDVHRFNNYLVLAYVVIWLVAVAYLGFLASRLRNARQELKLMKQLLEEEQRE